LVSHPLPTARGNDQSTATADQPKHGNSRSTDRSGPNHKTKPIFEVGPQ
jgi:hypothetical protein